VHVGCIKVKNTHKEFVGKLEKKDHMEDLGTDGRVILKWILKKQDRVVWTEFIGCRIGTSGKLLQNQ